MIREAIEAGLLSLCEEAEVGRLTEMSFAAVCRWIILRRQRSWLLQYLNEARCNGRVADHCRRAYDAGIDYRREREADQTDVDWDRRFFLDDVLWVWGQRLDIREGRPVWGHGEYYAAKAMMRSVVYPPTDITDSYTITVIRERGTAAVPSGWEPGELAIYDYMRDHTVWQYTGEHDFAIHRNQIDAREEIRGIDGTGRRLRDIYDPIPLQSGGFVVDEPPRQQRTRSGRPIMQSEGNEIPFRRKRMNPIVFTAELKKLSLAARNDGDICLVGFVLKASDPATKRLISMYGELVDVSVSLDGGQQSLFPEHEENSEENPEEGAEVAPSPARRNASRTQAG